MRLDCAASAYCAALRVLPAAPPFFPAAGSGADAATARTLFGVPDWHALARPLFCAAQAALLSHCKGRAAAVTKGKDKDPAEPMTQVRPGMWRCLARLSPATAPGACWLALPGPL